LVNSRKQEKFGCIVIKAHKHTFGDLDILVFFGKVALGRRGENLLQQLPQNRVKSQISLHIKLAQVSWDSRAYWTDWLYENVFREQQNIPG